MVRRSSKTSPYAANGYTPTTLSGCLKPDDVYIPDVWSGSFQRIQQELSGSKGWKGQLIGMIFELSDRLNQKVVFFLLRRVDEKDSFLRAFTCKPDDNICICS